MMSEIVKKMKEIVLYAFYFLCCWTVGHLILHLALKSLVLVTAIQKDAMVYSFHKKYPVPES